MGVVCDKGGDGDDVVGKEKGLLVVDWGLDELMALSWGEWEGHERVVCCSSESQALLLELSSLETTLNGVEPPMRQPLNGVELSVGQP